MYPEDFVFREERDLIELMLIDAGEVLLLTADEERQLFTRRDALREALEGEIPAAKRNAAEAELKRITEHVVRANMRLVVSVAKKYCGPTTKLIDQIQEGHLGLIKAVDRFDTDRGVKFSTYAVWWIRQAVTRAKHEKSRTIRLPVHLCETMERVRKAKTILAQESGDDPTTDQIAAHIGISADRVKATFDVAQVGVSLDDTVDDSLDGGTLHKFIADDSDLDGDVEHDHLRSALLNALDTLTPRESRILTLRHGLVDGEARTLKDIGEMFGLTRERIRQIEAEALKKLRHPRRARKLRDFYEGVAA